MFSQIGVLHDYGFPAPFWVFLGKLVSKALFQDDFSLDLMNFVRVNDHEFVGFIHKGCVPDDQTHDINIIEVDIKRPKLGQPVQIYWRPARTPIAEQMKKCVHQLPFLQRAPTTLLYYE